MTGTALCGRRPAEIERQHPTWSGRPLCTGEAAISQVGSGAMDHLLSVNEALARLAELNGQDVCVEGILSFSFDDVCISHFPAGEQRDNYQSSIWLIVGNGALGFDQEVCRRLSGRRVVVEGTLGSASATMGCGHMGLWPADLLARTLRRA